MTTRSTDPCPLVGLCAGKDCRKRKEFDEMRAALDGHCTVVELKCVDICAGPVVVVHPDRKRPVVYAKLRTRQDRRAIIDVIGGSKTDRLDKRLVGGGRRTTAIRRIRRSLPMSA